MAGRRLPLVGTQLVLDGTTYTDVLRVASQAGVNAAYTATYTFRAIGPTASAAQVVPVQQIASGAQIEHTDTGSAALPTIASPTNHLTLAVSGSPTSLPSSGGTVHYTVTVSGSAGATLDDVAATLPAGATPVPGWVTWRGGTVADGVTSGSTLTFPGPFTLGGSGDTLELDAVLPRTSGDLAGTVVAHVGTATVDASVSLGADDPAAATVHVNAVPAPVDDTVVATRDAAGTVTYTPEQGALGDQTFSYTVADTAGTPRTDTGTVTESVTAAAGGGGGSGGGGGAGPSDPVDDPGVAPVAWNASVLVDVLANDPDGAVLDAVVTPPGRGTAVVEGGKIRYTPSGRHLSTDSFTYTIVGSATPATVILAVTGPAPAAVDDTATAAHGGTPVTVDVLANDTGVGLAVTHVSGTAHGGTAAVVAGREVDDGEHVPGRRRPGDRHRNGSRVPPTPIAVTVTTSGS